MPSYIGRVYDLDFIAANDWCQALIRKDQTSLNIVVVTSDHRIQTILETSMIMSRDVEVSYEEGPPNKLIREKLNLG